MTTTKVSLKLPSIAPWLPLKQEFPTGQVDHVSNTLTVTLPSSEAQLLLKQYATSLTFTLVEV